MKKNIKTEFEEFLNLEMLHSRYRRGLNQKYYMTLKEIMNRDSERRRFGGTKQIHKLNAVNNSQQG